MTLVFRTIKESDLEQIMQWRMRADITRYMNTDPKLTRGGQQRWLQTVKADPTVCHWMIEYNGIGIGVINLMDIDQVNRRCSWGYYVAEKQYRSLKLAMTIEWNLYDYVFDVRKLNKLMNEVLAFNKEVISMHTLCGSEIIGTAKEHIYKEGKYIDVVILEITRDRWQAIREKYTYEIGVFEGV